VPFLTDLDSRAEVKGSRDPLGLMAIWSHFGREVVGNLSTVTSSVRGFTTLLLGLYYGEKVQELERGPKPSVLETFLKFEQLAGYARVKVNKDSAVRGWRRVNARLQYKRVRISTAADDQILSNQKVYGLWGLFSMPARNSELLVRGEQRLTDHTREFVERHYVPLLGKRTLDLLRRPAFDFDPEGRDAELAQALAKVHGRLSAAEKTFYRDHLAWGGPVDSTQGRQKMLAEVLAAHPSEDFGYDDFRIVRALVAIRDDGEGLLRSLDRIDALEGLINPARVVFGYLLTQNGQQVASVVERIATAWPTPPRLQMALLESMRSDIAAASWREAADRWLVLAHLLAARDYASYVRTLIAANTDVMQKRNGSAAWLTEEGGTLRVRSADEKENLLPVDTVENLWRSTYFINSLWSVACDVT
jgi:hypothetical protein